MLADLFPGDPAVWVPVAAGPVDEGCGKWTGLGWVPAEERGGGIYFAEEFLTWERLEPLPKNLPPRARILVGAAQVEIDDPVTFSAAPSVDQDGTLVLYLWDFGDGETGEGLLVSHRFRLPDIYVVRLTVADDGGAWDVAEVHVVVVIPETPQEETGCGCG